jgi:hypothetical protein
MIDPSLDQMAAQLREVFPAMWWALYSGMLEKGFTAEQSLDLLKTYISTAYRPKHE